MRKLIYFTLCKIADKTKNIKLKDELIDLGIRVLNEYNN